MLLISLILAAILLAVFLCIAWYALDDLFGGEDFATSKSTIRKIGKFLVEHGYQDNNLYDLGSSRGHFLLEILKICPNLRATGVDDSLLRTWIARFRALSLRNKPVFIKGDIFAHNASKAEVVFIYLPRPMLADIETKLKKELRPGSLVITSRVNLPSWQPEEVLASGSKDRTEETVYIYRK